jgi:hypothetical protein
MSRPLHFLRQPAHDGGEVVKLTSGSKPLQTVWNLTIKSHSTFIRFCCLSLRTGNSLPQTMMGIIPSLGTEVTYISLLLL